MEKRKAEENEKTIHLRSCGLIRSLPPPCSVSIQKSATITTVVVRTYWTVYVTVVPRQLGDFFIMSLQKAHNSTRRTGKNEERHNNESEK